MAQFSVSSDAELMWNVLPAIALPSQSKFLTARDRNGNPMVFGIGTDSILRVAQEDPTTRLRSLVELNTKIGLAASTTTHGFDLFQSSDDTIYLSLSYTEDNEARIMAVKPFKPKDVDFSSANVKLPAYKTVRLDRMNVKDLLLGTFVIGKLFPPIILNYTNVDKMTENVKHYEVQDDTVTNQGDLTLPVNTEDIYHVVAGRIKRHVGVFVLFKEGSKRSIIFTSWTTRFNSRVVCPPNAGYILTILNSEGNTDLIVGGDGIWHFASQDLLVDQAQASLICDGTEFQGINDMHIAANKTKACIWSATTSRGVSYAEIDIGELKGETHPQNVRGVPLIPAGEGGGIAGFVGSKSQNALLVSNIRNEMSYFEQAPDTKMWKRTPFWFPSLEKTVSIHSFMTRLVVHDETGAAIPGSWVDIASTGWVDVVVNGVPVQVGKSAVSLQTDTDGSLNIINPTEDISSYQFIVSAIRKTEKDPRVSFDPVKIDPMKKVDKILSSITADSLSTATTADGEAVFQGVSKENFETAAEALKNINQSKADLEARNGTTNFTVSNVGDSSQLVDSFSVGGVINSVKDLFWDAWDWAVSKYEKIKAWAIETYENVKAFVIRIGEEAYRFVLETATQIAKAAHFIYTKYLKAPFERLVNWLQNLFSWKDVVETKNNIVDFINATLDWGSTNIDWAADTLSDKFDGWNEAIKKNLNPSNIPDKAKNARAGPKAQDTVGSQNKEKMEKADVKQNWTKYQLTHGGALNGSLIEDVAGGVVKNYQDTWDTVIKPVFDSLEKTFDSIGDDLALLFSKSKDISAADVFQKVGVDVLTGIIDLVKTLIVGLLKRLSLLVGDFKELVNKKIKVPIFSDLWVMANKLFNRHVEPPTFTVIGFIGFILAIPITFTCKLFTGKKPPSVNFNVKTLSGFFSNSAPASDQLSYNGFSGLLENTTTMALAVVGLAGIVGVGGALAKIFDFQLLFGLVRVAVCFPTNRKLPLYEVRCAISAIDAVNVFVLAIARKVDKRGQGEKVLAIIEGCTAVVNIALGTVVNGVEFATDWDGKDDERTAYQVLVCVLGGASTIGKAVAVVSQEPLTKLAGTVTKQVAGKSCTFFNVVNTYGNIGKGKYTYILNSGS